jgi:quercetin dioxygenase-like cupin family protein
MEKVQDVMKAPTKALKLLLENERVRVLDVRLRPGEREPMHNHPSNHVIYVVSDAKFKLTSPDGRTNQMDLKAGQTIWMDAGSHATENVGSTDGHLLVVEVKK